jgi:hypothetical protein
VIRWEKARSGRFTVSRVLPFCVLANSPCPHSADRGTHPGALNWATGETVAVKEIQLSNIPKGELGQIMVAPLPVSAFPNPF